MNDIKLKDGPQDRCGDAVMAQGPNKPWEVEVDVYLESVGPPAKFKMKTCLPTAPNGADPNPKIVFENKGRKGFNINFNLYDVTNNGSGSGYVFPNPPKPPHDPMKWALWSKDTPGCPPAGHGQQWPEFESQNVKDQGKTLVVLNKNERKCEFAYTLRVTNDNGASFVDLDPGGSNQNGQD